MSAEVPILIAANQGEIGGGEVMLLSLAEVLRELGVRPIVVAPGQPGDVIAAAERRGFDVIPLGSGRLSYGLRLRRLSRQHGALLWCNGLYPAFVTAGMKHRVVHLHQLPLGVRRLMTAVARLRADKTLVPSRFIARHVPGSEVLPNWVSLAGAPQGTEAREAQAFSVHVGFLGRPSLLKGVDTLLEAFSALERQEPGRYRLTIAGKTAFVEAGEADDIEKAIQGGGPSVSRLEWVVPTEFLANIDVLVVPSVVQESFGLVAAEAMAARVPVVVSDAGALPEVVGRGHPWIFPSGDAEALAGTIRDVARSLPADEVVRAAYERWRAEYSREEALVNVRNLMDRLVGPAARV
ncbi:MULTISPECIES: glycosyltransferase family 4 protein [Arthrobacter]|uniref:Glycosyltransferase family 4 protein n=2 Tax=Arthrobacter TaxID=1663 RepID=A0ABU9KMB5_9MICC|nr:glycosyltransferase family 4 protein [Arthrobacter sp. YJM1]MDP5227716.1 glycosyltransferase family 4 protein [Arthrobacter sp. YJM1]